MKYAFYANKLSPIDQIKLILGDQWHPLTKEEADEMVEQSLRELESDIASLREKIRQKKMAQNKNMSTCYFVKKKS